MHGNFQLFKGDDTMPVPGENLQYSSWAGISSAIQSIEVHSLKYGTLIEQIHNNGRKQAMHTSATMGPLGLVNNKHNENLSGNNYSMVKIQAEVDGTFSLSIDSGFLKASGSYLLEEVGGIVLSLHLTPSAQFSYDADDTYGNCYYQFNNVTFSAIKLRPTSAWMLARAHQHIAGPVSIQFATTVSRLNQLQSNDEMMYDTVNFNALKSVYASMILASNLNNLAQDSFSLEIKDITQTNLSINGLEHPYRFPIVGATNTSKSALCRAYLEAITHSGKPQTSRVRTNIDVENYSDPSAVTPSYGFGYLLAPEGIRANGASINFNVKSDINNQYSVYVMYDIVKTLSFGNGFVNVQS